MSGKSCARLAFGLDRGFLMEGGPLRATDCDLAMRSVRRMALRSRGRFCVTTYSESSCAAQRLTDASAYDNCGYAVLRSRSTQHSSVRPKRASTESGDAGRTVI